MADSGMLTTPHDIIAELLTQALLREERQDDAAALIQRGEIGNLRLAERSALLWLAENWTDQSVGGWTAEAVRMFRQHRDGGAERLNGGA